MVVGSGPPPETNNAVRQFASQPGMKADSRFPAAGIVIEDFGSTLVSVFVDDMRANQPSRALIRVDGFEWSIFRLGARFQDFPRLVVGIRGPGVGTVVDLSDLPVSTESDRSQIGR